MEKETAKIIRDLLNEISYLRYLTDWESKLLKTCNEMIGE